jgi:hypothetical protein
MAGTRDGGERYSETVRAYLPEVAGCVDAVTAERARRLAEKPTTTADDVRQFRAALEAERARRKAAAAQLNRDLLALFREAREPRR